MKGLWKYLRVDRESFVFALGLALLFAGLFQLEIVGDYLDGTISVLMGLVLIVASALIRRIP